MKFASLFVALTIPYLVTAVINGKCSAPGGLGGVCISTSACTAGGGKYVSNKCPNDPADIKCCYKTPCDGHGEGSCDWTTECRKSGVTPIPGKCPGPTNFQCCVWP